MDNYIVNIEEVLDDLQNEWVKSSNFKYNTTAFTKRKVSFSNINMCCPYHNEVKPSFGISTNYPYMFNCFSCGKTGELIALIADIYEINRLSAYRKIISKYSTIDLKIIPDIETNDEEEKGVTEEEIFKYRTKKHSYMELRGISDHTLQKYEIGYNEKNYSITFPVRDLCGNPMFIVERNVSSKFYHIPQNAPKKNILYGLNYLYGKTDEVFIVEGAMDVLSCYQAGLPAIGLLGRSLSKNQLKLLQMAGIKKVILFLDNDRWGVEGNLDIYKLISKTPIKVEAVEYPIQWGINTMKKTEFKDPNDLLRKDRLKEIKVVPYLTYYYNLLKSKNHKGVV